MSDLPKDVDDALSHLNRFHHLEIGGAQFSPPPAPANASGARVCPHCGQANETQRETCWACFYAFKKEVSAKAQEPAQEITLVIDGSTYRSADPHIPEDVKVLMERIVKQGYSQNLFMEWQNWRATRNAAKPSDDAVIDSHRGRIFEEGRDINVFKGARVSVIKLDGKIYTSDNPQLTPEFKQLFHYLDLNGVTPALMDRLRQIGDKVKFRPETTAVPTDGDLAFWKDVQAKQAAPAEAAGPKFPWEEVFGDVPMAKALIPAALVFLAYLALKLFF